MADGWMPDFTGQRPPFQQANAAALVHGASSERRIAPLAAALEAEARASLGWPPHLDSPIWAGVVADYFRARAIAALLFRWLEAQDDPLAMLTETSEETSEETAGKGRSRRVTSSKRVSAVLSAYDKAQGRVMALGGRLGLDPASHAKITKDLSAARYMDHSAHPLARAVAERLEVKQRAELENSPNEGAPD